MVNTASRANRATTATPRPLLANTAVVHHNIRAMVKVKAKVKASTEVINNNSSNIQAATDHKPALADTADNRATVAALLADTASKLGTVDPRKATTAVPATTTTTSTTK
jgi:hypothetical protein